MKLEDLFAALFPVTFFLVLIVERFLPGREQTKVRAWAFKGIVLFIVAGVINAILPALLTEALAGTSPINLSVLGGLAGGAVAFLATTLADYWLHRLMHRVHWLWRWTHQMHHSAERVDIAGFAFSHPFELVLSVSLSTLVSVALGVTPVAAMIAGYGYFCLGLFSHLNVKTAHWLGYFVQRPEEHLVHHQRKVHAYNYGLPLWDAAFGTLKNPREFDGEVGFYDGASRCMGAMLIGRDVSQP